MAQEQTAAVKPQAGSGEDSSGYVFQNRRYVGTKETVAYVVYDMSQSFNINAYTQRFVTNILQVSLKLQRIANVINGIWDVINDVLFGAIVDKTRTRWGKFRSPISLRSVSPAQSVRAFIGSCPSYLRAEVRTISGNSSDIFFSWSCVKAREHSAISHRRVSSPR